MLTTHNIHELQTTDLSKCVTLKYCENKGSYINYCDFKFRRTALLGKEYISEQATPIYVINNFITKMSPQAHSSLISRPYCTW